MPKFQSPKKRTFRTKVGNYWITVYLTRWEKLTWNLSACISRSKRCSNDWNQNKNKRKHVKKIRSRGSRSSLRELIGMNKLVKKAIETAPKGEGIIVYADRDKTKSLGKYVQRLGFKLTQVDDLQFWVLITHQN
jgi:hypothetical protein